MQRAALHRRERTSAASVENLCTCSFTDPDLAPNLAPDLTPNLAQMDAAFAMRQRVLASLWQACTLLIQQALHKTMLLACYCPVLDYGQMMGGMRLCARSLPPACRSPPRRRQGCVAVLGWRQFALACCALQYTAACRTEVAGP